MEALALPQDDPLRVEHFRLFSRFYGRFDAKRHSDRTLTRHECVVNESAAQLCLLRPDLLTRRDQLFPLARKVKKLYIQTPNTSM
uniref:NAB co-repressor domain-containing protein n=1 Tax=Meloidogyne incognita TaxID=6306 RepID=A0A914MP31_MELIC